ncbi:Arc family DNA-binding protein [Pseudomonas sp. GOM6]|uniref:Arc family DNA-binding protein n=1 Tax=Pseudomonas sp. GOM6 TaxID=3036944 RepID=UPI00240A63F1|nr:Arc family DNA-binding protein [Pseudomonas sp. GOM6]MDG1581003.1 Arc family DNA-binding protein [Pseudomonas sp. GOM6]
MSRSDPQFNYRIPDHLKALLLDSAKANNRSMTAELNAILERTFTPSLPQACGEQADLKSLDKKLSAICAHLGIDGEI